MKLAAANAIAGIIGPDELHPDYIIPSVFDRRVGEAVAARSKKPPTTRASLVTASTSDSEFKDIF